MRTASRALSTKFNLSKIASIVLVCCAAMSIASSAQTLPLNGQYAFSFTGYEPTFFVVAGSLTLDGNGNVTGGELDVYNTRYQFNTVTGGTYSVSSDGLGQITFTLNTGDNVQMLIAAGNGGDIRVISMDTSLPHGFWGAGVFRQQNPTAFSSSALAGNWAFGFQGFDSASEPISGNGTYQEDSGGNLTNGNEDINDFGTHTQNTFTGNVTSNPPVDANGRVTMQYQVAGVGTLNLAVYVISAGEVVGIEIDSGGTLYVTNVLKQTGRPFNNGSLQGNAIGGESRQTYNDQTLVSEASVSLLSSDGNGNYSLTQDTNRGGTVAMGMNSGTYSVASNGRTTAMDSGGGDGGEVCYLVQQNEGFCIEASSGNPGSLFFQPQATGQQFGTGYLNGEYLGGSLPQYVSGPDSTIDTASFDGAGNTSFIYDTSGPDGVFLNQTASGTYTVDSTGAVTISLDNEMLYGYIVGSGKLEFISTGSTPNVFVQTSNSTLTVSTSGSGSVTSTDGFINCPGTCTHSYSPGTPVTLNATPASGSIFVGWSGACTGTGPCNITMTQSLSVTATFSQFSILTVSTNGSGTVSSTDGDINCPGTCGYSYPINTPVTLNAAPAQGWSFAGWSGACSGTGSCNLTMTQDLSATARFTQNPGNYSLTVSTSGSGTVTSTDGLINCPGTCSYTYASNAPVTLNASPAQGGMFSGWSGACSGTGSCNITMTQNLAVTATFTGQPDTVMHSFGNGNDGQNPVANLISDSAGNLYGTTSVGGMYAKGTVFEVSPNGAETILHSFGNGNDGQMPFGNLVFDSSGNLYGTTSAGGANGMGTVFELSPNGAETVLYSFGSGGDGQNPYAGLIFDTSGNLYGTTLNGGTYGGGTAFELSPNGAGGWTETVLYSFGNGNDGRNPYAGLIFDSAGNLYGTTSAGGTSGKGTAFELSPNAASNGCCREILVYTFGTGTDGASPYAGLVFDTSGNLYGTTANGGTYSGGTAFELSPSGGGGFTETGLYSFGNGTDGANPYAGLVLDSSGNLYGTTKNGGLYAGGTVFELLPNSASNGCCREKLVYHFGNGSDGKNPLAGLIFSASGTLYGTTVNGGVHGGGAVFGIMPGSVQFMAATPCRVVDTRGTDGTYGGPPISGGTSTLVPAGAERQPVQHSVQCHRLLAQRDGSAATYLGISDHLADRAKPASSLDTELTGWTHQGERCNRSRGYIVGRGERIRHRHHERNPRYQWVFRRQ